jgi:hypothetical protein
MSIKFQLKDTQNIRKKMQTLLKAVPNIMSAAIRAEAEIEATESKRRTPVDLGNLRASIHVEGPDKLSNGSVTVAIVAGGPAAPYALYVHENLEAYHTVGQAKFIESTLKESAPFLPARMAKRVQSLLASKVPSAPSGTNGPRVDISASGATIK